MPTQPPHVPALPRMVQALTDDFLDELDRGLPGMCTGFYLHGSICWGEFFASSDVDFVAVWDHLPTGDELELLSAAHASTQGRFPTPAFDGFHCTREDLAADPTAIDHRPAFYQGTFDPAGTIDINPVTWHELAEQPIIVRGSVPSVHTNLTGLTDYTRHNLDTYWRGTLREMEAAGVRSVGEHDEAIAWVVLGAARLHHLLRRGEITSKSGAGRYVVDSLDARWSLIAHEALRIRERPSDPCLYDDLGQRGQDMHQLLAWLVADGTGRG